MDQEFSNFHRGKNFEKDLLGSVSVDSVKVRCPKCYQPYKVFATDVSEPRPRFKCRECDSEFWLPFPEALNKHEQIGFPVSWLNVKAGGEPKKVVGSLGAAVITLPQSPGLEEQEPSGARDTATTMKRKVSRFGVGSEPGRQELFQRECSNCGQRHDIQLTECPHCQVVVEKADALARDVREGVRSTPELRELWDGVISNFENHDGHEAFLRKAELQKCMEFAKKRYSDLENAVGPEPKVLEMKMKIETLMQQRSVEPERVLKTQPKKRNLWILFSNLILVLSGIVCAVGLSFPEGKNMVGVGAAIAFFSLSLRLTQRS